MTSECITNQLFLFSCTSCPWQTAAGTVTATAAVGEVMATVMDRVRITRMQLHLITLTVTSILATMGTYPAGRHHPTR